MLKWFFPAGIFLWCSVSWCVFLCLLLSGELTRIKKYYKKLYRCRQTFLKPVHMNKWIHEMTFVCFILLLPHPHVECKKKKHIGKYQTFLLSMKWNIKTFYIFMMFANTWKDAKLPNEQEVDFSKESACYWISKCSVLISNKEVLFVLSWSGYIKN